MSFENESGLSESEIRRLSSVKANVRQNGLSEFLLRGEVDSLRFVAYRHGKLIQPAEKPPEASYGTGFEPMDVQRALRYVAMIRDLRQAVGDAMSESPHVDISYLPDDVVVRTFTAKIRRGESIWKYYIGGSMNGFMHITREVNEEKSQGKFFPDGPFTYTPPASWGFSEPFHVENNKNISVPTPVIKHAATLVGDFFDAYGNTVRQLANS